ncbi:hypothetical protein [Paludisphaera mucosa]|uniref:Rhodanese domain-containing protein n=1 Tax=Paludisphaera mucosa TaxID=3030827 RepID=A0ABT6FFD1_9BACT|nr:hypothetical protein [Paludisphaera mucosa]MDG3006292.1 hypothetical protein [Paludisphaera mucosa]
MFSLSWLRQRGLARARPSGRRRWAKALALGSLMVATMLQTGCRSGGFGSGCSLFSPCGFPARATSRIMSPFRKIGGGFGTCGDGCGTAGCDSPVEYGAPVGVVSPAVPLGTSTPTIIQGSPVPSTVPSSDSGTGLEPLPSATPDSAPTRSRSGTSSGVRQPTSSYETRRPVQNPGVDLTQSVVSSPASRSTTDATRTRSRANDADPGSVLDHLPPLDLPPEVAERSDSPPVAPAAVKTQSPASASAPAASPAAATTPTTTSAPAHDPSGRAAGDAGAQAPAVAAAAPAPDVDVPTNGALGVARFAAVDLKLAGGSVPSTVGLGWLAEKGYRTLLDLRDPSKIDPAFIGEAARRGLRYVSFPTDLAKLDREHLDRFSSELSLDAARPLYFFDEDGRVAGALWYIRRVLNDKIGWDVARREAENLGLNDAASWKIAREFVDSRVGVKPTAAAPAETPKPAAAPAAKPPVQAQVVERRLAFAPTPVLPTVAAPTPARAGLVGSDVWQPFAAMLVTGLSFRMAFIGRASIPTILAKTRASLPAPAPRS